jgi:glycosyltransferase involved in cell wall biosynthesis
MRVLFVISALTYGGAERQVVLLSRQLVRLGHEVLVYTLSDDVPRRGELDASGVALRSDRKRMRLDLAVVARLRRCIAEWRPSVVHAMLFDAEIYARLAGWGSGVPVLNSERNDDYTLPAFKRLALRLTRPLMDDVVANTHAGADFAARKHGIGRERVQVVWNGIDLDEVRQRLAASDAPARRFWADVPGVRRVCVVGALKPQKDHALALRVAAELHRRDRCWRFLFVGDSLAGQSAHKQAVLAQHAAMQAHRYVEFTGLRTDTYELMASCEALLVTSRFEGFPNVVLEAMACGAPVATTAYSDVRRMLPFDWQVAASRAPEALADTVERCVAARDAVVRAQRAWVERHATLEASAQAMLAVYAKVIERRHAAARAPSRGGRRAEQ